MTITTAHFEGKMPEYLWQSQLERIEQERTGIGDRIEQARARLRELQAQTPLLASSVEIQHYLQATLSERSTMEERREALAILVGPRGIRIMKDGTVDFDIKLPTEVALGEPTAKASVVSSLAI